MENVLDILRMGIDSTLPGLGKGSIDELGPDDVVVPDDFSPPARELIRILQRGTVVRCDVSVGSAR